MIFDQLGGRYTNLPEYTFAGSGGSVGPVGFFLVMTGVSGMRVTLSAFIDTSVLMAAVSGMNVTLATSFPGGTGTPTVTVTGEPNASARMYAGPMPIAYITSINRLTVTTSADYALVEQQFDPSWQGDPGADVELP